jgi:outer membrane protein OmpA-like peptidoglycan-associated protein
MRNIALWLALVTLAACAPTEIEKKFGNVRNEWVSSLRAYGSLPIYPIRENAYTGDVYLYVNDACPADEPSGYSPVPQVVWLGALPVDQLKTAFNNTYGNRPQLPETATQAKAASATLDQSAGQDGGTAGQPQGVSGQQTSDTVQASAPTTQGKKQTGSTPPKKSGSDTTTGTQKTSGPDSTTSNGSPGEKVAQPSAPSATSTDTQVAPQPTGTIFDTYSGAHPFVFNRLRMAAFPSLSVSTYAGAAAAANLPIGSVIEASAGAGQQTATEKTVTFSQIEVMDLPYPIIYKAATSFLQTDATAAAMLDPATITAVREQILRMAHGQPAKPCSVQQTVEPVIIVPTRIYYTRQIDFELGSNSEFAAQLGANLAGATSAKSGSGSGASSGASGSQPSSSGSSTGSAIGESNTVQNFQQKLAALAGGTHPGGGLQLAIGASGGLTLKQTFDRPMAFMFDQPIIYRLSQAYALVGHLTPNGAGSYACPETDPQGFCAAANVWLRSPATYPEWAPRGTGSAVGADANMLFFVTNQSSTGSPGQASNGRTTPSEQTASNSPILVAAAPTPQLPPVPVSVPVLTGAPIPKDFIVFFDQGGANLNPEALQILNSVADTYRKGRNLNVTVKGSSDRTGSQASRQKISLARAVAVREALVKIGVPKSAISVSGAGDKELLVQTSDGRAEAQNRYARITFE